MSLFPNSFDQFTDQMKKLEESQTGFLFSVIFPFYLIAHKCSFDFGLRDINNFNINTIYVLLIILFTQNNLMNIFHRIENFKYCFLPNKNSYKKTSWSLIGRDVVENKTVLINIQIKMVIFKYKSKVKKYHNCYDIISQLQYFKTYIL